MELPNHSENSENSTHSEPQCRHSQPIWIKIGIKDKRKTYWDYFGVQADSKHDHLVAVECRYSWFVYVCMLKCVGVRALAYVQEQVEREEPDSLTVCRSGCTAWTLHALYSQ